VFCSTRETRLVPGIGAMSLAWASSHANAICAGVASSSEATALTSSTMRRFYVIGARSAITSATSLLTGPQIDGPGVEHLWRNGFVVMTTPCCIWCARIGG
jgi:hypothetical protein